MSGPGAHLLADIGGTWSRFSLLGADGRPSPPVALPTGDYSGFAAALETFRARSGAPPRFTGVAVCVAAPVGEGEVRLTNSTWVMSRPALAEATGAAEPILINDFTAVALSLTEFEPRDLRHLGGGHPRPDAPRAVIGPGTGLGVSGLIPDGHGGHVPLASEGGHVSLAAADSRELEVLGRLLQRFRHVSAERVLSGPGLETLYLVLAELAGHPVDSPPGARIIARQAREGRSPVAAQALAMFTRWLGAVAGDLALTLGAHGGVYIAGGIIPAWGAMFDATLFRRSFEGKGRFNTYLEAIPTWLITDPNPAFKGLAAALRAAGPGEIGSRPMPGIDK